MKNWLLKYLSRASRPAKSTRATSALEREALQLNDSLLQDMQGIVLTIQAASSRIAESDPVKALIEEALTSADEVLASVRERAKALDERSRPVHEEGIDL